MFSTLVVVLQLAAAVALPTPLDSARRAGHDIEARATGINLPSLSYNPSINDKTYVDLSHKLPGILVKAIEITKHSWEYGTLTQALLETYNPQLTPFEYSQAAFDAGVKGVKYGTPPTQVAHLVAKELANYDWTQAPKKGAADNLDNYLSGNGESRALVDGDGSLGDPASLGPATWILAHWAGAVGDVNTRLQSNDAYAWAVGNQLRFLNAGPRAENGTISHREDHFEAWADQGYMIPPFLAYLGLTTNNTDLLTQAITQWELTSTTLLDPSKNLYRHVNGWDARFWATGNGWMLSGLMRVLASIKAAGGHGLDDQVASAEQTAANVFKALFSRLDASDRLPNYMEETDSKLTHGESTGTTAVVAAFYRFLVLCPDLALPLKPQAERAFAAVVKKVSTDGFLTAVVDPMGTQGFLVYPGQNTRSPEGQSLLAAMWAARTAAGQ